MAIRLKSLAASLAIVAISVVGSGLAFGQSKVLNIYNWSDYIAEDTIKNFEKETGIKVRYDNYDSNEVLHAKLVAGKTGYDIVVPGSHFAKTQIEGGLLQKLDRSKLTNWGNLDKPLLEQLAKVDPGNQYLVDWLWGYVTVGINVTKVKAALGDMPMPENAWSLLFDPKYVSKLKSCGVSVLDSASEVLPAALLYAGKPPYSRDAADYAEAAKVLKAIRPYVTRFSSSGYIEEMAGGATCLVMGFSGDINIARDRANDAKKKPKTPSTIAPERIKVTAIPIGKPTAEVKPTQPPASTESTVTADTISVSFFVRASERLAASTLIRIAAPAAAARITAPHPSHEF